MNYEERPSGLIIPQDPPKPPEPVKFDWDAYHEAHKVCPNCGSPEIGQTTGPGGPVWDENGKVQMGDGNRAWCLECGWKGIAHDKVPADAILPWTKPRSDGYYWLIDDAVSEDSHVRYLLAHVQGFNPELCIDPHYTLFGWDGCDHEPISSLENCRWLKIPPPDPRQFKLPKNADE